MFPPSAFKLMKLKPQFGCFKPLGALCVFKITISIYNPTESNYLIRKQKTAWSIDG